MCILPDCHHGVNTTRCDFMSKTLKKYVFLTSDFHADVANNAGHKARMLGFCTQPYKGVQVWVFRKDTGEWCFEIKYQGSSYEEFITNTNVSLHISSQVCDLMRFMKTTYGFSR